MAQSQVLSASAIFGLMGAITSIPAGYESSTIIAHSVVTEHRDAPLEELLLLIRQGCDVSISARQHARIQHEQRSVLLLPDGEGRFSDLYLCCNSLQLRCNSPLMRYAEQGKTYEETLLDADYAKSAGIPYRQILLDSWWCKWQPLSFRLSLQQSSF